MVEIPHSPLRCGSDSCSLSSSASLHEHAPQGFFPTYNLYLSFLCGLAIQELSLSRYAETTRSLVNFFFPSQLKAASSQM